MFQTLRKFIADLSSPEDPQIFSDDDYRVAATALLLHVLSLDGRPSAEEMVRLTALLEYRFALTAEETEVLISQASAAETNAVDIAALTASVRRALDHDSRLRLIEMMWEMVYADGKMTEFEESSIWRAASLLGISRDELVSSRIEAAGEELQHRLAAASKHKPS